MSNMINHLFQFYVVMLLSWDLFFAHVFSFWFDSIFKVLARLDLYVFPRAVFGPLCKNKFHQGQLVVSEISFQSSSNDDQMFWLPSSQRHLLPGLIWASLPCLEQLGNHFFCKNKESPEVLSRRSSNRWRDRTILGSIFGTDTSISHIQSCFLSNNGRNRSWCKCMVISRYDFVTKVTHDAQVQLREMFQMTKRSYFVVWPYPVKRKQWTELVPRSPKGRSRFLFQGTVLNILGCSHPGCQQQVKVL